jgi:hypothetical protein
MSGPDRDFNEIFTRHSDAWDRVKTTTAAWKEHNSVENEKALAAALKEARAVSEIFSAALKNKLRLGGTRRHRRRHRKTLRRK